MTCPAFVVSKGQSMNKVKRAAWVGLIVAMVFTLVFAPSRSLPPALPEPGARKLVAAVLGDDEDDRPGECCGVCPPIVGGGYDCTCAGNPRCERGNA